MSNAAVFLIIFAGTAVLAVLSDRIRFFARHGLLTGLALVGIALAAIAVRMVTAAMEIAHSTLDREVERVESDIDDQLGFSMQRDADAIIEYLARREAEPQAVVESAARMLEIDEINLVDGAGVVVASNTNRTGVALTLLNPRLPKSYRELQTGARSYVRERFRPNAVNPDEFVKYLGVRLPEGGFLQLGYNWTTFERNFHKYFIRTFEERTVGDTGFFLVADDRGRIVLSVASHPEAFGRPMTDAGLRLSDLSRPEDRHFVARVFGAWSLCKTYEQIGKWKGYAVLPIADIAYPATASAAFGALILVIFCVLFRLLLAKLRRAQRRIDGLRAKEEGRRAADMSLARAIQQAELRTDGTEGEGYRLATLMNAAREVGGDFYDYYELPDGRLVVTVADVSGKGIPAAFFMMKARTTLKSCVYEFPSLAEAVAVANVRLAANNPAEMFVTAWVGVYDRKTGTLDYVSAGHNPPLKVEELKSGKVEELGSGRVEELGRVTWVAAPRCAALGVFEGAKYRAAQTTLEPGDRLFLYTDGVTEAMNAAGELFGNDRLEATLAAARGPIIPAVTAALETFVAGAEQSDDITMLELEVEPTQTGVPQGRLIREG